MRSLYELFAYGTGKAAITLYAACCENTLRRVWGSPTDPLQTCFCRQQQPIRVPSTPPRSARRGTTPHVPLWGLREPAAPSRGGGTPLRHQPPWQLLPRLLWFGARGITQRVPLSVTGWSAKRSAPAESSRPGHALRLQRRLPLLWFYRAEFIYKIKIKNPDSPPQTSKNNLII